MKEVYSKCGDKIIKHTNDNLYKSLDILFVDNDYCEDFEINLDYVNSED